MGVMVDFGYQALLSIKNMIPAKHSYTYEFSDAGWENHENVGGRYIRNVHDYIRR